ncbi:unnamed protein product [Vitrella brassicaformis CCMP3155]|uniref:Stress-response A/B barrel domain-containing protein n=1 Tax=Vitrella brassicaformis (strain CCMP3155) TaxID=1169540 RepID=A0A0G4EVL5_VITBC|nr:unnamed protein product [Vitrella brassicaformis CCMP3155]|mmetsp:Transcript_48849/g.122348  ORF Transcript_48849/g.122348 Transcript_48849/m.122348 type:complete len:99 (+) Transcript_48849:38-334(+)|eukprot:CEM02329.1 unnamed protein product [Vitrella brassicaformis CCMP3155]
MVVEHIVLFKWKADAPADLKASFAADVLALRKSMAFIVEAKAGETFTKERNQGYDHVIIITLPDREHLPKYATHESHVALLDKYNPHLEGKLAMDIER